MPTWRAKKSNKTKHQHQEVQPHGVHTFSFIRNKGAAKKGNKIDHSFDDVFATRNSPGVGKDFSSPTVAPSGSSSFGFLCFNSDDVDEKRGLPLPCFTLPFLPSRTSLRMHHEILGKRPWCKQSGW